MVGKKRTRMTSKEAILFFFDLKDAELDIYHDLLRNGPATAKQLGERMRKDRSPAYTGVMHLLKSGLVKKTVKKKEEGGIFYTYSAVDPDKVQDLLSDRVDEWHTAIMVSVQRVSSDLRKAA